MSPPHRLLNPDDLPAPRGFSHAVVPESGRLVFLAGQLGTRPDGSIAGGGIVDQFEQAARNVSVALEAAGGSPSDLVRIEILVTDLEEYRASLKPIGEAYRRVFDRHYPAISLFEVGSLFDPAAAVELVCTAVVPDHSSSR